MRLALDAERLFVFMRSLGPEAVEESRVYLTGGASAVLIGWRKSTIDIDLKLVPDDDRLLRAIPRLKETLQMNVELASPDGFIPELPGWEPRSRFIFREGRLSFFHYDFYAQALSKIERGHVRDLADVAAMLERRLVQPTLLCELFIAIEPLLYRYPAIDPPSFRRKVKEIIGSHRGLDRRPEA